MSYYETYRELLQQTLLSVDLLKVEAVSEWLREARDGGKHVFICGNGGSAFTASHFATDLMKGASYGQQTRFRVLPLTDSMGTITAYANDLGYHVVFEEQLKNFAEPGDLLIAISGSGNSPNVLRAVEYANSNGCRTVGLTGRDGGLIGPMVHLNVLAADPHKGRVEDAHAFICHMLAYGFMDHVPA